MTAGQPDVSVAIKKRGNVWNFKNGGRSLLRRGPSEDVSLHDYIHEQKAGQGIVLRQFSLPTTSAG
ncbi:MAG: hypothetical protein OXC26_03815 [Albidovulum sp.]|nr:hypothetical protein [Albidovulum sp.]